MPNINGELAQAAEMQGMQQPFDPLRYLAAAAKTDKKEISLKTLTERQKSKIMQAVKTGYAEAKHYYTGTVEPKVLERTNIFNADAKHYAKKFPILSERSNWRSMDVQTAAEWAMPGLMEAFTGGDDPIDITGVDVNDDIKAKQLQTIIKYHLEKKNSIFNILDDCMSEALRSNFGLAKVSWKHEEDREQYAFAMPATDEAVQMWLLEEQRKGAIEIKKMESLPDAPDIMRVEIEKIKVTANHPVIEFLPPSELLFTPEGATLQRCKYVAHRKVVTGDYLKRKEREGIYSNVDKALAAQGETAPRTYETEMNPELRSVRQSLSDNDAASKSVELIEAYVNVDYNNDGIMEQLIVHYVSDVPVRISSNDFGFVPFFPCCAKYDPNRVFGEYSYADIIEQQQDLKTALIRQMIINIAQQNRGQRIIDVNRIDMDALIDGEEIIPFHADDRNPSPISNYVFAVETPQLHPSTMTLLEYAQNEVESQTGSTKYNQGLDSNSLNKTATGISMIMSAADKRMRLIARRIAENFYVPLVKAVILLNQKYMRDEEIFRINNQNVAIRREDMDIDYDLTINVGTGAGTKEARIQYLMVFINQLIPMLTQSGIADESTIYNAAKNLLEEMGLRSASALLTDPVSPDGQQKKQAAMQQQQQALAMQQQQQAEENRIALFKAILPRISLKFEDLPVSSQATLLESLGLGYDLRELLQKEILRRQNEASDYLSKLQPPQSPVPEQQPPAAAKPGTEQQGTAGSPQGTIS